MLKERPLSKMDRASCSCSVKDAGVHWSAGRSLVVNREGNTKPSAADEIATLFQARIIRNLDEQPNFNPYNAMWELWNAPALRNVSVHRPSTGYIYMRLGPQTRSITISIFGRNAVSNRIGQELWYVLNCLCGPCPNYGFHFIKI